MSDHDLVVIGGGFAGTAAALSLPLGTSELRANTIGHIIGADVGESLPDRAATTS